MDMSDSASTEGHETIEIDLDGQVTLSLACNSEKVDTTGNDPTKEDDEISTNLEEDTALVLAPSTKPKKNILGIPIRRKSKASSSTTSKALLDSSATTAGINIVDSVPKTSGTTNSRNPPSPNRMQGFLFKKSDGETRSYICEEKEAFLESDSDDERSLLAAEDAEQMLGSAMRVAEDDTGENFLAMATTSRNQTMELGKRVSTFTDDRPDVVASAKSLSFHNDDDNASACSWNSQATETTFIKVEETNSGQPTQEYWDDILASMNSEEARPPESLVVQDATFLAAEASPRETMSVNSSHMKKDRKWDKLRHTLEVQEKDAKIGYETEWREKKTKPPGGRGSSIGSSVRKSITALRQVVSRDEGEARGETCREYCNESDVVLRSKSLDESEVQTTRKGLRKPFAGRRKLKEKEKSSEDFNQALGPLSNISSEKVNAVEQFPVNIRVEDLSKQDLYVEKGEVNECQDTDPETSMEEAMEVLFVEKKSWLSGKTAIATKVQSLP